jgi:hypothetical protein
MLAISVFGTGATAGVVALASQPGAVCFDPGDRTSARAASIRCCTSVLVAIRSLSI